MKSRGRRVERREFLKGTTAAGLGMIAGRRVLPGPLLVFDGSPNEKVVVGVIGVNGRGLVHARNFSKGPSSAVAWICDVDSRVLDKAVKEAAAGQATPI